MPGMDIEGALGFSVGDGRSRLSWTWLLQPRGFLPLLSPVPVMCKGPIKAAIVGRGYLKHVLPRRAGRRAYAKQCEHEDQFQQPQAKVQGLQD